MRLVMSKLVGSLRAAGFTVDQQVEACINLGRAFGVDLDYLQQYLERNVSSGAGHHPFFRREWRPLFQVGDRVVARGEKGVFDGVVRKIIDPSELGVAGLDLPYQYLVENGTHRQEVSEDHLEAPPEAS